MDAEPIRILLIEDNSGDVRLIREMLADVRDGPFHLDCAEQLSDGLARLAGGDIDVVLLDLSLSDSHGLDTLRRVHAHAPAVPIVVLTGIEDEALGVQLVEAGAQDYLVKGQVTGQLLVRAVRYAMERKQAEEALQESEERFRAVIQSATDAIIAIDSRGEVVSWNRSAQAIFGHGEDEMLGRSLTPIIPERYRDAHRKALRRLRTGGESHILGKTVELHGLRKDGREFPLELSLSAWQAGGQAFYTAIIRDTTERKRTEEALRQSEERYRDLFETARDVVFVVSTDGTITSLNAAFETITGWLRDEWIGKHFEDLVHPDDLPEVTTLFRRSLQGKTPPIFEVRVLSKSGEYLVMELAATPRIRGGEVVSIQGIARDITERKRAQERLRLQGAALKSAANAIVITDREGTIRWINLAFTRLTGYTAEEAVGENPRILKSGEHDQAFYQELWDTILSGRVWHGETINRRKDGTLYTEEQTITPVRDERGEISHFISIKQDVTARVRAEERLAKINECLLGFGPDPRENMDRLTDLCGELMGAACALYNRLDQGMLCSWGQWNTPSDYDPVDKPHGHICYDVIQRGDAQPLVVRNLPETPYAQTDPNVVPYNLQTYVGMPVKFGGAYVGSLCVVYQADFVPSEEDKRLMQIIASAIGVEERRYHAEESLRRHDAILEAVGFAAGRFLQVTSWEETIQDVLERLGQATAASRVYLFENYTAGDGTLLVSQRYEWTAPGITPQIDNPDLQNFPLQAGGFGRWEEILGRGQLIHGHVRDFPEREQDVLAAQDIQSIVVVPLFVGPAWWGFIGFDECLAQRDWSAAEIDALKAAADTLGAAIQRQQMEEALRQAEEKYRTIFENAVTGIYQTTLEGEWLTANPALARTLGYASPEELMENTADLNRQFYVDPDRRAEFTRLVQEQGSVSDFESQVYRKDGRVIWVSERARAVRDSSGRLVGFEGTTVDITERKKAEEIQRRLTAVIETTSDFVAFADLDGRPLYLNRAGREMLGLGEDEEVSNIRISDAHPQWASELVLNDGIPTALREGIWTGETALLTRDGREIPVLQVIVAPRGPEGGVEFHATIMRDITARKQAEEQIKRQLQRLAALREIDMAITASMDMHVTFNVLLDQVTAQLGVDAGAVLLLDPHTQTLKFAAGRGFRTAILQHTHLRLGEGYAGRAALERRIISIPNLAEEENALKRAPLLPDEQFIAYYGTPLVAKGEVKGVLEIFHRAPLDPDPEWLDFLEALATQAAIAIDNAELFDDLQRSHAELTLAYDTTLEGWARALELRDHETEGHSRRVTELTLRLARAMGMRDEQLVHVRRGALLHDIGKMGVPDSILLKPGPLDDGEWVIMRQHPVFAYELLSPIRFLRPALDIPYCHHEKWNGTGYPRGLKGEQIPLAARVFAVVDVYDALTSDRPYRDAWPEEKALAHIREQAGQHFDPQVVEAFLEVV